MEFWGTEVAPGEPQVCHPGDEMYCHVSQAALGPSSNGKSERVVLRVETGGKDVVLGTLVSGKCDQMALDLIFDREFKLSHTSTSCSVYFCGYKTEKGEPEEFDSEMEEEDEEESEDEEVPNAVPLKANGDAKPIPVGKVPAEAAKKASKSPVKAKVVDDEAEEVDESDEDEDDEVEFTQMNSTVMDFGSDDDEDDSEYEDDEDDSDVDDSDELDEDEDESDDEDESEDEEMATPEVNKKRPLKGADVKTPTNGKKAKVETSGGAGSPGKKSDKAAAKAAVATPASTPAKTPSATPGGKKAKDGKESKEAKKEQKSPQKTPGKEIPVKTPKTASKTPNAKSEATPTSGKKTLGPHKCDACNRSFATETAASQHMTAKHGTPATGK